MSDKQKVRRTRNETSRNEAGSHWQPWGEHEVQMLIELWPSDTKELVSLAGMLGRTVEACRQKYYSEQAKRSTVTEKAQEAVTVLNTWTTGYTNLSEMGY